MPCMGPTADENRDYERKENKRKFGVAWDNEQLVANIACAFGKALDDTLRANEFQACVPKWADLWWQEHKKRDEENRRREEVEKRTERKKALQTIREIAKEYNIPIKLTGKI